MKINKIHWKVEYNWVLVINIFFIVIFYIIMQIFS
jgi:hypothetical protein